MALPCMSGEDAFAWAIKTREEKEAELERLRSKDTPFEEWEKFMGMCAHDRENFSDRLLLDRANAAAREQALRRPGVLEALANQGNPRSTLPDICNCGSALAVDCAARGCDGGLSKARGILAGEVKRLLALTKSPP